MVTEKFKELHKKKCKTVEDHVFMAEELAKANSEGLSKEYELKAQKKW